MQAGVTFFFFTSFDSYLYSEVIVVKLHCSLMEMLCFTVSFESAILDASLDFGFGVLLSYDCLEMTSS